MLKNLSDRWSLNSLYRGESQSPLLKDNLAKLKEEIEETISEIAKSKNLIHSYKLINHVQHLQKRVRHKRFFVNCLNVQDITDQRAKALADQVQTINSLFNRLLIYFDAYLLDIPEDKWKSLVARKELKLTKFYLNERRTLAKEGFSPEEKIVVNELMTNGYHAWGKMYRSLTNEIKIPYKGKKLTIGQAYNELLKGNRQIRKSWYEQWDKQSHPIATVLNSLAGFRIDLYRQQGIDNVLLEPLNNNRVSEESLKAMWKAIERKREELLSYLDIKKELLNVDSLKWYDFMAPMQFKSEPIPLDYAANLIVESFHSMSEDMAEFSRKAFLNKWVETENRDNKSAGAFCVPLPLKKESRIFMTFTGTSNNINALAHELGHGYHQYLIRHLPSFAQLYPMSIGEGAAIFAELVMTNSLVERAENNIERTYYLENKVNRGLRLLLFNYSIFLFEKEFYEKRKRGVVSKDALNALMLQIQQETFNNKLDTYDPLTWATRTHYYMTNQPFYNFPYTIGYLISQGIYKKICKNPRNFANKYRPFLKDSGRMTLEELMQTHFTFDLTKVSTWEMFIEPLIEDLKELSNIGSLNM